MKETKVIPLGWQLGSFQFKVEPFDPKRCKGCRLFRNATMPSLDGGLAPVPTGELAEKAGALICIIQGLRQNAIPSDIPCSPKFADE